MLRRQVLVGVGLASLMPSMAQALESVDGLDPAPGDGRLPPAAAVLLGGRIETAGEEVHGLCGDDVLLVSSRAATPSGSERQQALRLINGARAKAGVAPLTLASKLGCAAQGHARYMASARRCGHTGSGGSTFVRRIEACGYRSWRALGENVACGQSSWSVAMRQWLASPGHRANLLSPRYRNVGLGRYDRYYVQDFGAQ